MTASERLQRQAIVWFIHRAIGTMSKRVWTPGEHVDEFHELPDGAVPVWWLEEQLDKLKGALNGSTRNIT